MGKINERCAGIDVGKRFLLCCVLTGARRKEPCMRTLRLDTTVAALIRLREWLSRRTVMAMFRESTSSLFHPLSKSSREPVSF
jgi:hypothetical protein